MEKVNIKDGFCFLRTNYIFNQPTQIEANLSDKKFAIVLSLKGNTSFQSHEKEKIEFKEGFTTISMSNNIEGLREFETKEIEQVRLVLDESFLQRNLKESIFEKYFCDERNLNLINFSPTSIASQFLLRDLLNCQYNGELIPLYTEAKALELLS